DQHNVAGLDRDVATLGAVHAGAAQDIDAFLEAVVEMRSTRLVARLRHRDLGDAEADARTDLARHRLERSAARQAEPPGIRLVEQPRHQVTCRKRLTSAVPPCTASSCLKISLASRAIASEMSLSMRSPFSAVACCGLPNQPVGAIERTSVSTG